MAVYKALQKSVKVASLWMLGILLGASVAAHAGTYDFSYSGRLVDSTGRPLAGPVALKVGFFHSASSTTSVLDVTTGIDNVMLKDGVFQIVLSLDASDFHRVFPTVTQPVFIEITDLTSSPSAPYARQQLTTLPYAGKIPVDSSQFTWSSEGKLQMLSTGADASATATLTNKTIDANTNTITGISNTNISATAAIDDSKLATVSTAGKVSGSAITSGTIAGSTAVSTSGSIATTGKVGVGAAAGTSQLEVRGAGASSATSSLNIMDSGGASKLYVRDDGNVGIGTTSPNEQLEITGNFRLPNTTSLSGTIYSGGSRFIHNFGALSNLFAGVEAGNFTLTGDENTMIGYQVGDSLTSGNENTAVGTSAFTAASTATRSVAIGFRALQGISTGGNNIGIGWGAMNATSTGHSNIAIGWSVMSNGSNNAGNYNIGLGVHALDAVTGSNNIGIGQQAGQNITSGSNNIIIGSSVDAPSATSSNQLNIGNTIYGNTSTGNVGIGTTSPGARLTVNGAARNASSISNASTTIDFSTGNLQHTSSSCGVFTLNNLQDGGSYTLGVKGTSVATCSFSAYSDVGVSPLTVHLPPGHGATTSGKHTLYTLLVMGTDVYLSWMPGY